MRAWPICLAFLFFHAIFDMKTKMVYMPLVLLQLAAGCLAAFMISPDFTKESLLCSFMPGFIVLFFAWISRESIGYGDGWLMIACGPYMRAELLLIWILLAFFLAFAFACLCPGHAGEEKKMEIAFVPFLFLSFLLLLFRR